MIEAAAEDGADRRPLAGEQPLLLRCEVALGRKADDPHDRAFAERLRHLTARFGKACKVAGAPDYGDDGPLGLGRDARADAAEDAAEDEREQGAEQEEDEGLGEHRRPEVAPRD